MINVEAFDQNKIIEVAPYDVSRINNNINNIFKKIKRNKFREILKYFIGNSYVLEPLGEGLVGAYSEEPLYRTDMFDCVTYVDTVLALNFSNNLIEFQGLMNKIRYQGVVPKYINRTDWFTDLEWIPNLQRLGLIQDVTEQIFDINGSSVAKFAKTTIDKPNWYKVRTLNFMHLLKTTEDKININKRLQSLQLQGQNFSAQDSEISYLPLDKLFDSSRKPVAELFNQIPSGSVIAIVRPNWNIRDRFEGLPNGYGTNLNVSHLGIVVRENGILIFYNASSIDKKIVAEPLVYYLARYLDSPTVKGVHVERIVV